MVVDASIVVELLLGNVRGRLVEERLAEEGSGLHAPSLLDVEVVQTLRRLCASGELGSTRGRAATELLQELPVRRHSVTALVPRMWALRDNLTACDAAYVALAEGLERPLLTFDQRLASAPGHLAEVVVPG